MKNSLRIFIGGISLFVLSVIGAILYVPGMQGRHLEKEITWLNYPLPDFQLTNQDGRPVTLSDLKGQVWVADIVFTRCGGPCPVMTRHLSQMQPALYKTGPIRLVTLTTDPEFDSPAVMQKFGGRFQADFSRWLFLTGDKSQFARLARDGMRLVAVEKSLAERENDQDLFIHSTRFVVVDKKGVMRAALDSTDPDIQAKLLAAVRKLQRDNG